MTTWSAKDKYDLNLYWPGAVAACKYEGGLWALPYKIHPGPAAIYYNVQQMQEAGVTVPEKQWATWDDLKKAAKAATKDGRFGLQLNLTSGGATNTPQPVTMFLRSWGTDLYSAGRQEVQPQRSEGEGSHQVHVRLDAHR